MLRLRRMKAWSLLAAGMLLGAALCGALSFGVLVGQRGSSPPLGLADMQLKAMATHGSDTFAVATGNVDDDVEGLFTLDFVTGDLQCFVINPRNGAIGGWFKTNVAAVFTSDKGKKPNYLLTTGHINVAGGYGGQRPAASLCYVADANSGEVAAFSFPWVKAATTAGAGQATEMRLVHKWPSRTNAAIRQ